MCSGRVYKTAGTYNDTCRTSGGCDSLITTIITLDLCIKDTVPIIPVCDTCAVTVCMDTIYDIVNGHWTLCDGSQSTTTGLGSYSINQTTGCITYTANGIIGKDTLCIIVCNAAQTTCDTIKPIVVIVPTIQTITDTIKVGETDSICVPIQANMTADSVSIIACNGTINNITQPTVISISANCVMIKYTGTSIGTDDVCVIVCDNDLQICDTTKVIIVVEPKDTIPIVTVCDTCTTTVCLDTIYNITNGHWTLCDGSTSATSGLGSYNIDTTTGCITYSANGIIGKDTLCIIVCDSTRTTCDSVPIIIDVVCSVPQQILVDTVICSNKPIVINGQTISTAGTYNIRFTAHNTCDSIVTYRVTTVDCGCELAKGFSPNGDGVNDLYVIKCLSDLSIDGKVMFRVYNRWGIEVYRNNVYDNTFDGNYRGSPLPDGTYFFVLEYTNKLNQAINVSSYITIQR
jgi:gliding motility-associated-like protein